MLNYIKGELTEVMQDCITLENNGIGYQINVPVSLLSGLPPIGREVKIYTYLYVREDALQLYGFFTRDDLQIFRLLIGVSGIGPKGALGILSNISPDDLRFAILSDDVKAISKAPGIGNKTAQKLIIELKDKLDLKDAFEQRLAAGDPAGGEGLPGDVIGEAAQALAALGYSQTDALKAVKQVELTEDMTVEQVLKQALKKLVFL
jgi:Holliday junction DNA helicase RuvA